MIANLYKGLRPLQNPFYNLSFLNILCTFIVWNKSYPLQVLLTYSLGKERSSRYSLQINTIIDWAPIRAIIEVAYTKGYKSTGRPSYDSLVLFKIESLRTWYGLRDGEVEDQVNDRLSFSRFAGLGMEDIVPDSTTVCRFRNILVEADLYDTLLEEFNYPNSV